MIVAATNDNFVTSFVPPPPSLSFPLTTPSSSSSSPLKLLGVLSSPRLRRSRRLTISNDDNDEDAHVMVDDDANASSSAFDHLEITDTRHRSRELGRRRTLSLLAAAASTSTVVIANSSPATATTTFEPAIANAAAGLGTLPEFANIDAILQSVTIDCDDIRQYEDTLNFFMYSFDMKIMRQRSTTSVATTTTTTMTNKKRNKGGDDNVDDEKNYMPIMKETWLGYGPEELSIPNNFILPVSSFAYYGGHSSLHIRYIPSSSSSSSDSSSSSSSDSSSSSSSSMLYPRTPNSEYNNEPAPGNNIAYIQLGVPAYRISQMVKYGGNVVDAYGYVNVISPAGVPVRAIVGIKSIDPIMFIAINCNNVTKSTEFYTQLGFSISEDYPYARPNAGRGQFEPPQPKGSVYLSPCKSTSSSSCTYYGMGILLLPKEEKKTKSIFGIAYGSTMSFTDNNVNLIPNPVVKSLNIVYDNAASTNSNVKDMEDSSNSSMTITDPSYVPITFLSQDAFTREIKMTTIKNSK